MSTTLLIILVYLVGFVISYYSFKFVSLKIDRSWDWVDFKYSVIASLFSWVALIVLLIACLARFIVRIQIPEKPPI